MTHYLDFEPARLPEDDRTNSNAVCVIPMDHRAAERIQAESKARIQATLRLAAQVIANAPLPLGNIWLCVDREGVVAELLGDWMPPDDLAAAEVEYRAKSRALLAQYSGVAA